MPCSDFGVSYGGLRVSHDLQLIHLADLMEAHEMYFSFARQCSMQSVEWYALTLRCLQGFLRLCIPRSDLAGTSVLDEGRSDISGTFATLYNMETICSGRPFHWNDDSDIQRWRQLRR